ncbi:hypothetical protein L7F22_000205 [Adiantum nelumboides]|nr:hypothetical protein [Adiantum nelumboides]
MTWGIYTLYEHVSGRVRCPGGLSDTLVSTIGVKQGCPLSPTLFGLYIDEIVDFILHQGGEGVDIAGTTVHILLYADDIVSVSETAEGLQLHLQALDDFCSQRGLTVNLGKTKGQIAWGEKARKKAQAVAMVRKRAKLYRKYKGGGRAAGGGAPGLGMEDPGVTRWVLESSNSLGFARGEAWSPGIGSSKQSFDELFMSSGHSAIKTPLAATSTLSSKYHPCLEGNISVGIDGSIFTSHTTSVKAVSNVVLNHILERALAGVTLKEAEIVQLFSCMGEDFREVCAAANQLRSSINGSKVSYVVNRNINYTNICSYKCQFCAFSKGKSNETLRGKPYNLSLEEIARRVCEAWDRGATEICMQGGIHPEFTGETYLEILRCAKSSVPDIHVHAFSPLEVYQGAKTLGLSISEFLLELKRAGLGSLPGTSAEILDDEIRAVLCPDKLNTQEWLEVMRAAHAIGLRSTSTIMFGHIDDPHHWARHLLRLRELQKDTGGFTEFVPLPFVHMEAPLFLRGKSRKGPTRRECILIHAVARLVLHPYIKNIQASWVKLGPSGAQALLMAGCNDMGGSLMNESITRAAGASHGEELSPTQMEVLIRSIGRDPEQRTTLYGTPTSDQVRKSLIAAPLQALK